MKKIIIILTILLGMVSIVAQGQPNYSDTTFVINEVVVTGTNYATSSRNLPITVTKISSETLEETNRVNFLPTLSEQVPGLFITQRGMIGYGVSNGSAGGMNLRGLSSSSGQLLVLIDGHPQYQGIYGHSISDSYQTMMADRIEVLRGPASVLYGSNAMGGVINIITKGMYKDGIQTKISVGAGSWGTFQTEVSNQLRHKKFQSTFAVQYSRSDNHRSNMGFEQYGGYAKFGYEINNNWNVYADADVTHFNSSYPGKVSSPMIEADQWITRGVANIGIDNHYALCNGSISVNTSWGNHKINDGYGPNYNNNQPQTRFFRSEDILSGVRLFESFDAWKGAKITLGFDWQHIYGKAFYTSRETGEVLETSNKQSANEQMDELACYLNYNQIINEWFSLSAGIRYDNHTVSGSEWIPQTGIVIYPCQSGVLKVIYGKGFRNPTLREIYMYPSSNQELKAERIHSVDIAWRHRLNDCRFTYGLNLFYTKGDNIIQTVNRKNINSGKIENCGAEADVTYHINKHWSINSNHSYLYMDKHIISTPIYKGYLGANMRYGKISSFICMQHVTGLFTAVGEKEETENFTLVNASVGYQVFKNIHLWIKGENLLAQRYEILSGYPMPKATFMGGLKVKI